MAQKQILERQMLVRNESLLYSRGWQLGRRWACPQKPTPPADQGARAFKGEIFMDIEAGGGGYIQSGTVSSDSHLEIGPVVV